MLRHFAVLRHHSVRGRTAQALVNATVATLPPGVVSQYGLDLQSAGVVTTATGATFEVIGGSTDTCLVTTAAPVAPHPQGVGCSSNAFTLTGDRVGYSQDLGGAPGTVFGLVPDGIASVEVTWSDGSTASVGVTSNIWSVRVPAAAAALDPNSDPPLQGVVLVPTTGTPRQVPLS
jgi:hypothetical protein